MRLYLKHISMHVRSQLQYRASTIMVIIAQMFIPLSIFATTVLLFQRFGSMREYTLYQVALCYAVAHMGFSFGELFFRGFDIFSYHVRSGNFDRMLLRPKKLTFQVFCSRFELSRTGRIIQAVAVFIFALVKIQLEWTLLKIIVLCMMILSSVLVFGGVFILGSSVCFFTIQGLEFVNIFTDGGRELAQYPLTIYQKVFRLFFTFIIPFGAFNYLPLSFLLDKTSGNPVIYALIPLISIPFLALCLFIWNKCSKHYKSAGG
jgi:ABC-2 type transport system permease protein